MEATGNHGKDSGRPRTGVRRASSELQGSGWSRNVPPPPAALPSLGVCFAKVSVTHSLTGADLGKRETRPGLVGLTTMMMMMIIIIIIIF